jgi:ribosome assembly protein 3
MFENYGEDINNLRNASDFNERSLSILANALKNGGNIFDEETLKAVVGGNTN